MIQEKYKQNKATSCMFHSGGWQSPGREKTKCKPRNPEEAGQFWLDASCEQRELKGWECSRLTLGIRCVSLAEMGLHHLYLKTCACNLEMSAQWALPTSVKGSSILHSLCDNEAYSIRDPRGESGQTQLHQLLHHRVPKNPHLPTPTTHPPTAW